MRQWLAALSRGPLVPGLVVAAVGAFVGVELAPAGGDAPEPVAYRTADAPAGEASRTFDGREIGRHAGASSHHRVVTESSRPQFHRLHDETLVALGGEGTLLLDGEPHEIGPGRVFVIPRGTVHSIEVTGEAVEAISVFSPPFDGRDRHYVE
jgi:quercetin dioxygenase-like cupin family protein